MGMWMLFTIHVTHVLNNSILTQTHTHTDRQSCFWSCNTLTSHCTWEVVESSIWPCSCCDSLEQCQHRFANLCNTGKTMLGRQHDGGQSFGEAC